MSKKLADKVALVTGGSAGIGLASAKALAEQGAKVYITGRRQEELDAAVRFIGPAARGIRADAAVLSDLDTVFATIAEESGRLDVLFANAGGGDMLPLSAITEAHVDRIFATNVRGVVFTVQKALPLLADGASVILTGSTAAVKGTANFSIYSASKAAVRSLARSWALEVSDRGIRINVVSPAELLAEAKQKINEGTKAKNQELLDEGFLASFFLRRSQGNQGDERAAERQF